MSKLLRHVRLLQRHVRLLQRHVRLLALSASPRKLRRPSFRHEFALGSAAASVRLQPSAAVGPFRCVALMRSSVAFSSDGLHLAVGLANGQV
jgi:hypothetical protein